jgi:hypothetical protein
MATVRQLKPGEGPTDSVVAGVVVCRAGRLANVAPAGLVSHSNRLPLQFSAYNGGIQTRRRLPIS